MSKRKVKYQKLTGVKKRQATKDLREAILQRVGRTGKGVFKKYQRGIMSQKTKNNEK